MNGYLCICIFPPLRNGEVICEKCGGTIPLAQRIKQSQPEQDYKSLYETALKDLDSADKTNYSLRGQIKQLEFKIKQQDKEYVLNGSVQEWKDYAERTKMIIEMQKEEINRLKESLILKEQPQLEIFIKERIRDTRNGIDKGGLEAYPWDGYDTNQMRGMKRAYQDVLFELDKLTRKQGNDL